MTYKDKLKIEHPKALSNNYEGGCKNCPDTYGYEVLENRRCPEGYENDCERCWNREMPMSDYDKGLNDAWGLADRINNMTMQEVINAYGFVTDRCSVFSEITPREALVKLEAYEKEQNDIKVGDVVEHSGNTVFVVTKIDTSIRGYDKEGATHCFTFPNSLIKKTDKHIDIQSILDQLKD